MEIMNQSEKEYVRVIIAQAKTGSSKVGKPMKSIPVKGTSVEDLYGFIFDAIKSEQNKNEKKGKRK